MTLIILVASLPLVRMIESLYQDNIGEGTPIDSHNKLIFIPGNNFILIALSVVVFGTIGSNVENFEVGYYKLSTNNVPW